MSKKNLKYLSQSVLLEEGGLPNINKVIIASVFLILLAFIVWSNIMTIDEVAFARGYAVSDNRSSLGYSFVAKVTTRDIPVIAVGDKAYIKLTELTSNVILEGKISQVDYSQRVDSGGKVYYEANVSGVKIDGNDRVTEFMFPNMEVEIEIITGSRTMFEYLLRPIFRARESAFKER